MHCGALHVCTAVHPAGTARRCHGCLAQLLSAGSCCRSHGEHRMGEGHGQTGDCNSATVIVVHKSVKASSAEMASWARCISREAGGARGPCTYNSVKGIEELLFVHCRGVHSRRVCRSGVNLAAAALAAWGQAPWALQSPFLPRDLGPLGHPRHPDQTLHLDLPLRRPQVGAPLPLSARSFNCTGDKQCFVVFGLHIILGLPDSVSRC